MHAEDERPPSEKSHAYYFSITYNGCDFCLLTPSAILALPKCLFKGWRLKFRDFMCLKSCLRHCNWNWSALHKDEHKKDRKHKKLPNLLCITYNRIKWFIWNSKWYNAISVFLKRRWLELWKVIILCILIRIHVQQLISPTKKRRTARYLYSSNLNLLNRIMIQSFNLFTRFFQNQTKQNFLEAMVSVLCKVIIGLRREKIGLRGFRPGHNQASLLSCRHYSKLENGFFLDLILLQ